MKTGAPAPDRKDHYDLEGLKILELGCGLPFLSAALVALGAQVAFGGFFSLEGSGEMKALKWYFMEV